jgi:hypothetical protein
MNKNRNKKPHAKGVLSGTLQNKRSQNKRQKMQLENTRSIETFVSLDNIKSQVAVMLQAFSLVKDSEDILDLEFKETVLSPDGKELVPIVMKLRKDVKQKTNGEEGA